MLKVTTIHQSMHASSLQRAYMYHHLPNCFVTVHQGAVLNFAYSTRGSKAPTHTHSKTIYELNLTLHLHTGLTAHRHQKLWCHQHVLCVILYNLLSAQTCAQALLCGCTCEFRPKCHHLRITPARAGCWLALLGPAVISAGMADEARRMETNTHRVTYAHTVHQAMNRHKNPQITPLAIEVQKIQIIIHYVTEEFYEDS